MPWLPGRRRTIGPTLTVKIRGLTGLIPHAASSGNSISLSQKMPGKSLRNIPKSCSIRLSSRAPTMYAGSYWMVHCEE